MSIAVEVITPDKVVSQTQADAVVIPAWDGELGILANHSPLLAALREGEIRIQLGDQINLLAVSGGFVEVKDNRVRIFAETAELAQEIDIERARQAVERAKASLVTKLASGDLLQTEAAMRRALARLRVAEGLRRKTHVR